MPRRSPRSRNFKKTVFANGLTLISERHPEFRSLSIGVWVKVGTRDERPGEAGASHFLEHMLFKGTDSRSALDIAREVDRVGGDFNAFTTREYTCFHILLLDRDVRLGLDILSDIVLNSNFHADELERERKVILQEIAMVEESHEELAHDLYFEQIYPRHGLGRPILGTERSIRRMKRADVLRFFRRHYRPDQIVISVAGDVSHEAIAKRLRPLARREWPGRPPKSAPAAWSSRVGMARPQSGRWWVPRPSEQAHLIWGVEGPKYSARDRYAAYVLNMYLGGGMSSALFQEIREKHGLAYTVYSNLSPFVDTGVFSIYVGTALHQIPFCLKLIRESIDRLKKNLLTDEELETTKDSLKGAILLSADSAESRMSSIGMNELFFGDYWSVDDTCKMIDAVAPADVRRLGRRMLDFSRESVLALGPRPSRALLVKLRAQGHGNFRKLSR